jgi:hypothetical protein
MKIKEPGTRVDIEKKILGITTLTIRRIDNFQSYGAGTKRKSMLQVIELDTAPEESVIEAKRFLQVKTELPRVIRGG